MGRSEIEREKNVEVIGISHGSLVSVGYEKAFHKMISRADHNGLETQSCDNFAGIFSN